MGVAIADSGLDGLNGALSVSSASLIGGSCSISS